MSCHCFNPEPIVANWTTNKQTRTITKQCTFISVIYISLNLFFSKKYSTAKLNKEKSNFLSPIKSWNSTSVTWFQTLSPLFYGVLVQSGSEFAHVRVLRHGAFLLAGLGGHVVPVEACVGRTPQAVGGGEGGPHVPPVYPVERFGGGVEDSPHPMVKGVEGSVRWEKKYTCYTRHIGGSGTGSERGGGCRGWGFEWGMGDGDCKSHLSFMKLAKNVIKKKREEKKKDISTLISYYNDQYFTKISTPVHSPFDFSTPFPL